MATNFKMQGELEPGLLMDVLQVLNRRRNLNGYVEVTSASVMGRIWLQEGAIISAIWNDRQGELAVECMLRLKQGLFEVGEAISLPAKTISKDTTAILMMCMRAIGRDSLAPAAPTRLPPAQQAPVQTTIPVMTDEPMPTPVRLPVDRPCKRGFVVAGRWSLGIAAAILLVVLGTGGMAGTKLWTATQTPVPVQVEPVPVVTPTVPVIALPAKPVIINDGWPNVMLSALAASGKRHYCAILNGQLLGVGEQVDGVTVRSIRANGVVLEYQGQRRFLCAIQQR
ncbi:MAG: DUF4388 domain-containing protein [bacterium]|jgi:hypothetical protein